MSLRASILLTTVALATPWAISLASAANGPTVTVAAGQLSGTRKGGVEAYLGIPYAAPPVGGLRWHAPQPLQRWAGERDATHFGASCYQIWPPPLFGPYTSEYIDTPPPSEDCLYLNVWTPGVAAGHLPVMVWIHGGGFLGGSGAVPIYDGTTLAAQGVVVVTINYRVGPFGFLALPELRAESPHGGSGNYGLLDMIAALKWVQRNIGAFGGDPTQVTIAGQSAGAVAVNDLIMSPAASGLFARGIAESGSGMGVRALSVAEAEHAGVALMQELGVASLAQFRALPPERIQAKIKLPIGGSDPDSKPRRVPFSPVLEKSVLPADPDDPTAPLASNVPLLTGYNADEAYDPSVRSTPDGFERLVRARYAADAERFLALYPHADDAEATSATRELARDRYMAALILWARQRTRTSGRKVYAYLFDHAVPTPKPPSWGAFHTAEVPYIFGVLDPKHRPYTQADSRVSRAVSRYWINFISRGNPNSPTQSTWHLIEPASAEVMELGDQPGPRAAVSSRERLEAFQAFLAHGGQLSLF